MITIDGTYCHKNKCRWFLGAHQPDETEATECLICVAFPTGIPDDIAYGENKHTKVVEGQQGVFTYEKQADNE